MKTPGFMQRSISDYLMAFASAGLMGLGMACACVYNSYSGGFSSPATKSSSEHINRMVFTGSVIVIFVGGGGGVLGWILFTRRRDIELLIEDLENHGDPAVAKAVRDYVRFRRSGATPIPVVMPQGDPVSQAILQRSTQDLQPPYQDYQANAFQSAQSYAQSLPIHVQPQPGYEQPQQRPPQDRMDDRPLAQSVTQNGRRPLTLDDDCNPLG